MAIDACSLTLLLPLRPAPPDAASPPDGHNREGQDRDQDGRADRDPVDNA